MPISNCVSLTPVDNQRLALLCGQFDEHLKQIEKLFDVKITNRGHEFQISGEKPNVRRSEKAISELYDLTNKNTHLTREQIHEVLQNVFNHFKANNNVPEKQNNTAKIDIKKGYIKTKGKNQKNYVNNIKQFDINFAIGPAGTGKTFLAVACAIEALESHRVNRIILVRPAVEAGERLGFLPGDLVQKVDPYLRPLYDALYSMLSFDYVTKLIEKNTIEVAPLAFMRGRTLNDSFIILDEGQNSSKEQMKMFLTRIGFGSIAVVTGDITQIDLPKGSTSGLSHAIDVCKNIQGMSFSYFTSKDVVRHPLVQKIIDAYDKNESR